MKYPSINKQPIREVSIPSLSGGLNLRDGLSKIKDNQLTECVNMWYKDGILRTRPGLNTNSAENIVFDTMDEDLDFSNSSIKVHNEIKDSKGNVLVSYSSIDSTTSDEKNYFYIRFVWHKGGKITDGKSIKVIANKNLSDSDSQLTDASENSSSNFDEYSNTSIGNTYFTIQKDEYIYVFIKFFGELFSYKWQYEKNLDFEKMDDFDFYAPLVMVEDNLIRGYNLLGGRYKGKYEFNTGEERTKYNFPVPLPKNSKVRIYVSIGIESIFEFTSDESTETVTKEFFDGKIKIKVVRDSQSYVEFLNSSGESVSKLSDISGVKMAGATLNYNAVCDVSADIHKVLGMQERIFYGGSEGIYGGSRLFLGANKAGKERNLIMWSSLENPLYFPENNYVYVGDKSQPVTAFGIQDENLIIFKEKSIYFAYSASNNDISAEDIIEQTIVDIEANSTFFVISILNGSIGCDLPRTIALCRNRLVWGCTKGEVYTLVNNNRYNERSVFKISEMVEKKLKQERNKIILTNITTYAIKNAYAFDCCNHYCLLIQNRMYLMDYNSYGFSHISSFSKNEDSNVQIPWYFWELPRLEKNIVSSNVVGAFAAIQNEEKIIFIANYFFENQGCVITDVLNFENSDGIDKYKRFKNCTPYTDESKKIPSCVRTKLFDLNAAGYLKNINSLNIIFGNNKGINTQVEFISDVGREMHTFAFCNLNCSEQDATFLTSKNFYPTIRATRIFGIEINCDGNLFIDEISLRYRLLGGVK